MRLSAPEAHLPTPLLVALALLLVLGARLIAYARRYSVDLLYWDQWDFLDGLFHGEGALALAWHQHGPHRQGLGGIMLGLLYPATAWSTRAEVLVSACAVFLAAAFAVLLLARLSGPKSWLLPLAPLLVLTTGMGEVFVHASNPAHGPLPLLLVMGIGLAWTAKNAAVRSPLAASLGVVAIFTGFAFFAGVVNLALLGVEYLRARRTRSPLWPSVLGLAATVLGLVAFFHGWRFAPAVDCFRFPDPRPAGYLEHFGLFLAHPFGLSRSGSWRTWTTFSLGIGMLALVAESARRVVRASPGPTSDVVLFLVGFTCLFGLNSALGRVCLGVESAAASRYVPYAIPGWLGVSLALSEWIPVLAARNLLLASVAAVAVRRQVQSQPDYAYASAISSAKRQWAQCYRQNHQISLCDERTGFRIYPDPRATGLEDKLRFLEDRRLSLFRPER